MRPTTHKPQSVIDAVTQFYTTINANIYRGIHLFAEQATDAYEDVRKKVAHFIGAHPQEDYFLRMDLLRVLTLLLQHGVSSIFKRVMKLL